MKFVAVLLIVAVSAVMAEEERPFVRILSQQDDRQETSYKNSYESEDGTVVSEEGREIPGTEGPVVAKIGSYKYIGPDGQTYEVQWQADEQGFRAIGDHLPTN